MNHTHGAAHTWRAGSRMPAPRREVCGPGPLPGRRRAPTDRPAAGQAGLLPRSSRAPGPDAPSGRHVGPAHKLLAVTLRSVRGSARRPAAKTHRQVCAECARRTNWACEGEGPWCQNSFVVHRGLWEPTGGGGRGAPGPVRSPRLQAEAHLQCFLHPRPRLALIRPGSPARQPGARGPHVLTAKLARKGCFPHFEWQTLLVGAGRCPRDL